MSWPTRSALTKVTRPPTGTVISNGANPLADSVTVGGPDGLGGDAWTGGVGATGVDAELQAASWTTAMRHTDRANTTTLPIPARVERITRHIA